MKKCLTLYLLDYLVCKMNIWDFSLQNDNHQSSISATDPVSETYSATVEIVLGLLAFLIVIAIVIALVYYCYKRKKRLEAEAQKKREEEERQARIEREKKERMRMERAALTPTLDLGLPDDSVFDITRLFYEEEEPVTPTKVDTDLNERLIDRDTDVSLSDNGSYLNDSLSLSLSE